MSGARWHERVYVVGQSSSGKSEVLNLLFSGIRSQKVLIDTKPEFTIPDVTPTRSPEELRERIKTDPVIHYVDHANDLDEYDEVFHILHHRRHVLACCHELADLCDDQPSKTPKWVRAFIRKGNVFGNGMFGGSQRPVGMPRVGRTEAQHVIIMNPPLDPDDLATVAGMVSLGSRELTQRLQETADLSPHDGGRYSFLWFNRRDQRMLRSGPLPVHVRDRILVRRLTNV